MTKSRLLKQLLQAISNEEWKALEQDTSLPVSTFNRQVLLELKTASIENTETGADILEADVSDLCISIKDYLREHLPEKLESWKWILISCVYLTFLAERPMHPIDFSDIKVTSANGQTVYECSWKRDKNNTLCRYCVCRPMSNYEIMKRQMQKKFLEYDQEQMIEKFHLCHDSEHIYIAFLGRLYQIQRSSGKIFWSDDRTFLHDSKVTEHAAADDKKTHEADYNEAMTIYDVLCNSKEHCIPAGEFLLMQSLVSVHGSSGNSGTNFFQKSERFFDHKDQALSQACEKLNGIKIPGKGDVSYQIPLFDFLPIQLQFWNSDEEFPPVLQLFWDKHILDYMHYETAWFAASHLVTRLQEELKTQISSEPDL